MPEPRIALAFDFGRRRIGMATGDTLTATAAPRAAVAAQAGVPDWGAIEAEIPQSRAARTGGRRPL